MNSLRAEKQISSENDGKLATAIKEFIASKNY
ncbi:hypothetical protein [Halobacteriovorax sp. ZH3_bin.1]